MEEISRNYKAKVPRKRRGEKHKFIKIYPRKKEYDRVVEMVYKPEPGLHTKGKYFWIEYY